MRGETLCSVQDATIAATYAMLAAVDLGLSTVWLGAFDDDEVAKIFGAETLSGIPELPSHDTARA